MIHGAVHPNGAKRENRFNGPVHVWDKLVQFGLVKWAQHVVNLLSFIEIVAYTESQSRVVLTSIEFLDIL